jgi:hypothetical protein
MASANAPRPDPAAMLPTAMRPVNLAPKRCRMTPAGKARTRPVTLKTDINKPAWLRVIWNSPIKIGIRGGTLFWLSGAATLARKTTKRITQA